MSTPKVFESEYRFCLILWDHEPIKSRDLAQLCAEQLGWKVIPCITALFRGALIAIWEMVPLQPSLIQ